jgi:hypothetical protein
MEIHAPHQPILSVKEALVHLGIVTIGILIALSLEGIVEWQHHRNIVREATANIADEIRDNDNELRQFLEAAPKLRSNDTQAVAYLDAAIAHHAPERGEMSVGFTRPDISSASWTTAQTIGALGLMDYRDVKRYAAVYELQEEFLRLESRTIDAVALAMATFQKNESPDKLPLADLQLARQRILEAMGDLVAEEQIAQALDKRYQSVLQSH